MTSGKKKLLIPLIIVLLVLLTAFFYWFFSGGEVRVPVGEEEEIAFHFRLEGNEVVGWSKGQIVWRIKVETIVDPEEDNGDEDVLILKDISEGYFYRDEEVYFSFTVEEAHYHTLTEDLTMFDVRMETPEGDWLESDMMEYEKDSEILHSPGPVWGEMARTDIEAENMTVFIETEELILGGGVKMLHKLGGEE